MGIVPAGVHHALDLGGEFEARFLLDWQRIHVRAQEDRRAGEGALERRHHRRQPLALSDAQPQAVERLENRRLRPGQLQTQLRMAVDRAPEANDVGLQLLGFAKECRDRHAPMLRSAAEGRQRRHASGSRL